MSEIFDTVIIGGGPAGYTAALYTARAGLSTLIVERMAPGGQMTVTDRIDNYPGFPEGIDGWQLGERMREGAERFGARTEYTEVTAVDLAQTPKRITTATGDLLAKTVILAMGADPRPLGLPNEGDLLGRGVHTCAHCDGRFYKGKTVAVVGGGNTALEDALYLSGLAARVYLIHRRNDFRGTIEPDIRCGPDLFQRDGYTGFRMQLKTAAVKSGMGDILFESGSESRWSGGDSRNDHLAELFC